MKIGELFIALGFKVEGSKALEDMEGGIKKAAGNAAILAAAVNAVNLAILYMMNSAREAAVEFKNFEQTTGQSAEELKRWQYAAEQNDVSAKELAGSIEAIQQAQAQIKLGGGNIAPWQLLGISPNQNPFEVLRQLRERALALPPDIARAVISQMGVSDGVFRLLRSDTFDVDGLERQYVMTRQQQAALIDLNKAWKDLLFSLTSVRDKFAAELAPAFTSAAKALKGFVDLLAKAVGWLSSASPVAVAVKWAIIGIVVALGALGVVLAVIAAALGIATLGMVAFDFAASPILPILGAVSAIILVAAAALVFLALAIDDVITYIRGGKSELEDFGNVIANYTLLFMDFYDIGVYWVKEAWKQIVGTFDKGVAAVRKSIPDWLLKFLALTGSGGLATGFVLNYGGKGDVGRAAANGAPDFIPRGVARSSQNSVRQDTKVTINVDGSGDPRAVGREVSRTVADEISDAAYQIPLANY